MKKVCQEFSHGLCELWRSWWLEGLWSDLRGGCRRLGGERPRSAKGWCRGGEGWEVRPHGSGSRWRHPDWPLWAWAPSLDILPQPPQAQQIPSQTHPRSLKIRPSSQLTHSCCWQLHPCDYTHVTTRELPFIPLSLSRMVFEPFHMSTAHFRICLSPKNLVLSRIW